MSINRNRDQSDDVVFNEIRQSIRALKFGTVTIKIHAGKVVQVELTEKKRFGGPQEHTEGGGI